QPFTGQARIVGITGPPGAGKSTLVDALAWQLRQRGKTIAILAVDPSSRISGGAILGDRIRMQQHHADPGIFIRSMATRGTMGGLARATADLAHLMEIADIFVVNKSDRPGADRVELELHAEGFACPILRTVATEGKGMAELVEAIDAIGAATGHPLGRERWQAGYPPGPPAPPPVPTIAIGI